MQQRERGVRVRKKEVIYRKVLYPQKYTVTKKKKEKGKQHCANRLLLLALPPIFNRCVHIFVLDWL